MVIDSACFLSQACEIDGVLIIAPNGVHHNWTVRELPRHHWDFDRIDFAWRFSDPKNPANFEAFLKASDHAFPWFAINMESLIRKEVRAAVVRLMRRCPNLMVVFDESHHFARPGAKRTSMARGLARRAAYRRILTGTAVENSPLQAFSQYELLKKGALGFENFGDFKRHHAVYEMARLRNQQMYPRLVRYEHLEELRERMSEYTSVVLRSDCEDLPPIQKDIRYVELSARQIKAWRALKDESIPELVAMGMFKPVYGGAALIKLQQIEGGYMKSQDGRLNVLGEDNPKMQALLDEIQQYDGQVIVWFAFIHEIEAAAAMMQKYGIAAGEFHGKISDTNRDRVMLGFEKKQLRVLLGQPKAAGEGRDFSTAGKIVWYSQSADAIARQQASERATAVGGKSVQLVDLIVPGGIDEYLLELTDNKVSLADAISRQGMKAILGRIGI
jgi:hypothetical protein